MSEESSVEDIKIYFIYMFMLYVKDIDDINFNFDMFSGLQMEVEENDTYQDVLKKCIKTLSKTKITDGQIDEVFKRLCEETLSVINRNKDKKDKLVGLDNLDTVKKEIKDGLFKNNNGGKNSRKRKHNKLKKKRKSTRKKRRKSNKKHR